MNKIFTNNFKKSMKILIFTLLILINNLSTNANADIGFSLKSELNIPSKMGNNQFQSSSGKCSMVEYGSVFKRYFIDFQLYKINHSPKYNSLTNNFRTLDVPINSIQNNITGKVNCHITVIFN